MQVRLRLEPGLEPAVTREISLDGDLDDEQRARLTAVAERCPVQWLLSAPVPIATALMEHTAIEADDGND